jgi:hypothetical protein
MEWNLSRGCLTLIITMVVFIMMSMPIYAAENKQDTEMTAHDYILDRQQSFNCSMVQMNDDELSAVTAAGFSSFTLTDNVTRAYLNIEAQTFTEIQSLKMGNYDGGWDEDWTGVSLGSSTESLICKGLYIEAGFSSITDPSARTLNSIKVGTPSMTGPITANFNSFSGRIETGGTPGTADTHGTPGTLAFEGHRDTTLGTKKITSTNSEFYIQLSVSGPQKGWWFYWNNATISTP